jgi:hypothetical protein
VVGPIGINALCNVRLEEKWEEFGYAKRDEYVLQAK